MSVFTAAHHSTAKALGSRLKIEGDSIEYQPGDGTRYLMAFHSLTEGERRFYGCGESAVLVTVMSGGNRYVSSCLEEFSHISYISEKLNTSPRTSEAVEHLLQFVYNPNRAPPAWDNSKYDWAA